MTQPVPLLEIWRGEHLESQHFGHGVVCDASGQIVEAWGDPDLLIYPRSSCKMLQALPLVESGAADAAGLTAEHLALACASHSGAAIHTDRVNRWLSDLSLAEPALRCGSQTPSDVAAHEALVCENESPCQIHNNCSGKHTGFLTLGRHLNAGPEYIDPDHPVQRMVLEAFEDMIGETSPGFGIDGCSAPNHLCTLSGFARGLAKMAARSGNDARQKAATRLTEAMMAHPELVAGEGRACTELMRACAGQAALKTGAEGVYSAILPQQGLGIAIKAADGATRAAEAAIAAVLIRYGVLPEKHPDVQKRIFGPITNWRKVVTGHMRVNSELSRPL